MRWTTIAIDQPSGGMTHFCTEKKGEINAAVAVQSSPCASVCFNLSSQSTTFVVCTCLLKESGNRMRVQNKIPFLPWPPTWLMRVVRRFDQHTASCQPFCSIFHTFFCGESSCLSHQSYQLMAKSVGNKLLKILRLYLQRDINNEEHGRCFVKALLLFILFVQARR